MGGPNGTCYQLCILPCPIFAETEAADSRVRDRILEQIGHGELDAALSSLETLTATAPFDVAIRDAIICAVDSITAAEQRRGEIARTDRSALDPTAQTHQDFIDSLLFQMAGLTVDEIAGLETRLQMML